MDIPKIKLNNGLLMPQIGLGAVAVTYEAVKTAITCGYRLIDTAEAYHNEEDIGRALAEAIKAGEVKREDMFISTKLWCNHFGRDQVMPALKESLKRLGVDYVDLYLVHIPCPIKGAEINVLDLGGYDNELDINTETWPALEECVKLGLTKSIGVSNFNSQQIDALMKVAQIKPVTNQIECHPLLSQRKLIDHCAKYDIVITSYSPFGGMPADAAIRQKFEVIVNFDVRESLFENELIKKLAVKYGKSAAQILLRYHIERGCIVVPKSVTKSRLEENLQVIDFAFTKDELAELEGLNQNVRYAHFKQTFGGHKNYPFNIEY